MYSTQVQNGLYLIQKNGKQLLTPGGTAVKSSIKVLAERLVTDLECYGEDPGDPVSLVAFHYSMLDYFVDAPIKTIQCQLTDSFDPEWDWTLTCPTAYPHNMFKWWELFGMNGSNVEKGLEWLETLSMMQLCAVTIVTAYTGSVNIAFIVATVLNKSDLKKFVKEVNKWNKFESQSDLLKVFENYLFYFNEGAEP